MGDVAVATESGGPAGEGARLGRPRDFIRAATEPFLASWQTLTGIAWLAGRITRALGRYYAGAAIARLTSRPARRRL